MLDILFSHSYYYPLDKKQWENKTPYPPLGTIYAASLMRENDFSVSLFDTNLRNNPFDIEKEIQIMGSCLLTSSANLARFHQNWTGLAVLFSRQLLKGSQDFFFVSTFLFLFMFLNMKPLSPLSAPIFHVH